MNLESRWDRLVRSTGTDDPSAPLELQRLLDAYSERQRFYHNVDHLSAVLASLDELSALAKRPNIVELAAWYHDAVYDPRASDNEAKSADWAARSMNRWSISAEQVTEVRRLILLTKTHDAGLDDVDAHVLLDADLAILGSPQEIYDAYARAIRREYAWVPPTEYSASRARVLESFLKRNNVYSTPVMRVEREAQARRNLMGEIQQLRTLDKP